MSTLQKILFFFVLPILAPLILPPDSYSNRGPILFLGVLLAVSALFVGPFLWRGRSTALTLAIFIQGMNMVMRLMMFFPNLMRLSQFQTAWFIASLLSMALSMYVMVRLDRSDVRVTMVT